MQINSTKYLFLLTLILIGLILAAGCSTSTPAPVEETATNAVTISLPGTGANSIFVTSQGKLLKKAEYTSSDGNINVLIDPGTTLLSENKTPLQSIVEAVDPVIPVPPENAEIVGDIVDLQPPGATIIPSLKITLSYDPSAVSQGVNKNDLWVYRYAGNSWEMVRNKNLDSGANRVTAAISRFGKYSVLAPTRPVETPHPAAAQSGLTTISVTEALENGKPTLAEFGRGTCIPCKEMKPILENLAIQYEDQLNVPIVSIDDYRDLTNFYRIMAIPTQIGFDSSGKEVFRHVGFWPKDQIIPQLVKLGIK
jgi:thioredoxin 1